MQCPSCGKSQPMSFRCRSCGAELMKRGGAGRRPAAGASPRPRPQAAAAAVAVDNPYQAPVAAPPVRVTRAGQMLASRGSRLAAQFVDGLVFVTIYIPLLFAGALSGDPNSAAPGIALMVTFLILGALALVQIRFLSRDGQTIGKKALKIRIVRYDDGGNPGFSKAVLLRAIVNGFLGIIPAYALVDILFIFGAEQRCIHDLLAGTKVVQA